MSRVRQDGQEGEARRQVAGVDRVVTGASHPWAEEGVSAEATWWAAVPCSPNGDWQE